MRLRRGVEHVEREQCIQPPLLVRVGCWWLRHGVTCSAASSTTEKVPTSKFSARPASPRHLSGDEAAFPTNITPTPAFSCPIAPARGRSAARRASAYGSGASAKCKQDTARQDGRHRVRHQIKARLKQASSAQPTLPSTRISPLYTVQCTLKSTESHDDSRCCPVYGLRDNALALYSKG